MATGDIDVLISRVQQRLGELGLSERKASLDATGTPDALRYIRTRRAMPSSSRLIKIAAILGTTPSYLMGETDDPAGDDAVNRFVKIMTPEAMQNLEKIASTENWDDGAIAVDSFTPLGFHLFDTGSHDKKAVNIYSFGQSVSEILPLPAFMSGLKVYAVRMPDSSMYPVYEAGSLIICQNNVRIKFRDDLIVTINGDAEHNRISIFGRLMRRSSEHLELQQYSPPSSFMVAIEQVTSIHRVLKLADLLQPVIDAAQMPQSP